MPVDLGLLDDTVLSAVDVHPVDLVLLQVLGVDRLADDVNLGDHDVELVILM